MALSHDAQGDPLTRHTLSPSELKDLITAERLGRPFLVYRDQERRLMLIPIGPDGRSRTLGRRPEMDISIFWDNEVSGLHAELQSLGANGRSPTTVFPGTGHSSTGDELRGANASEKETASVSARRHWCTRWEAPRGPRARPPLGRSRAHAT